MKILFWSFDFWPTIGGIEMQCLHLIRTLQSHGHKCIVITEKHNNVRLQEEQYQGTTIYRFPFHSILTQADFKQLSITKNAILSMIETFQPDLIHLNTCFTDDSWSVKPYKRT